LISGASVLAHGKGGLVERSSSPRLAARDGFPCRNARRTAKDVAVKRTDWIADV
jgi:hypothetical protein